MDNTTQGAIKPQVLALMAEGRAQQEKFIEQLSEAERAAVGEPDAWVAKDHIAHNAAWIFDAVRQIDAAMKGETPEPSPEDVDYNPVIFAARQHKSWDEVIAYANEANEALQASLEACSEEDLADPGRFEWRKGRPLWYEASMSGYEHPAEHFAQFYRESGDLARAKAAREAEVEMARKIVPGSKPYGFMTYNVGAFYAQIGEPDKALASMREVLEMLPSLRGWAKEDPDLASLHDNPEFQALVAEPAEASTVNN